MECIHTIVKKECPCPKKGECPRHGKCCECVAFHRDENGNLPFCLRK